MRKILIADDDRRIAELASAIMKIQGYEAIIASDGRDALEKALRHKPDLVLLDVMMPEMPGFAVCEEIRAQEALKGTKVIMVSAHLVPEDKWLARLAGADGFISKPFDVFNLMEVVNIALA